MPHHANRLHRRTAMLGAVLAVHLLGLGLLLRLGAWKDRGAAAPSQRPVLLWLLNETPPPRQLAARPPPLPQRPPATVRPAVPAANAQATQAITVPAPAAPAADNPPAASTPPTQTPAADPEPAPLMPLNLALPRGASAPWRARNPVLDNERANTNAVARQTVEAAIAAALGGSDQVTEERLDDGRLRLRRGSQCVLAYPNRAERIDPFNSSVLPKLRGLQKC